MASFELNPCKACWEKYKSGGCDINTINSCVVETAAAFNGIPSNNSIINTPADKNWQDCIVKMMKAEGRSPCDLQLAMAPVFYQTPHYFPSLFAASGNPDQALSKCLNHCSGQNHNKIACMQNCKTDRAAVQEKKENFIPENSKIPKLEDIPDHFKPTVEKYDKGSVYDNYPAGKYHPVIFWMIFGVVAVLLAFFVVFFIRVLMSKKIGKN